MNIGQTSKNIFTYTLQNFLLPMAFGIEIFQAQKEKLFPYKIQNGYLSSGLTALNARSFIKTLYVILKHYISGNKALEQSWRHLTSLKLCKIICFSNTTPILQNSIYPQ